MYLNFVKLDQMLHAKFQDHRTSGSEEEYFLRFSPYMGMWLSWSCDLDHIFKKKTFVSYFPMRLHIKFGFDWSSSFRPLKVLKTTRRWIMGIL